VLKILIMHFAAIVSPVVVLFMLSEKVSRVIRNSKYWALGVIVYLLMVVVAADSIFQLSEYYGVTVLSD